MIKKNYFQGNNQEQTVKVRRNVFQEFNLSSNAET